MLSNARGFVSVGRIRYAVVRCDRAASALRHRNEPAQKRQNSAIPRDPRDTSAKRLKNYPLVLRDIEYTVLFSISVSQRLYYAQTVGRGLTAHAFFVDDVELPLQSLRLALHIPIRTAAMSSIRALAGRSLVHPDWLPCTPIPVAA